MKIKSIVALMVSLVLLSGVAQAQDFSFRFGFQLLTIPSVQLSNELDFGDFGLGSRFTAGTWFGLITRVSLDSYGFVPIAENWQVYFGAGLSSGVVLFNGVLNDIHGLVGIRLKQGLFVEFVPRLFFANCYQQSINCVGNPNDPKLIGWGIDFGFGFSWRL
jgi:hypothetical protein